MFRAIWIVFVAIVVALLTACGQPANVGFGEAANKPHEHTASDDHSHDQPAATSSAGAVTPVLATSEVVVGPNRLALGLLENNVPIKDAAETKVRVRYFKLAGNNATAAGEEDATYYGDGLGERGTFIVKPTFDTPGAWGIEVIAQRPGKAAEVQRMSVEVKANSAAPTVGTAAPQSKTPTDKDVQDLKQVTSSTEPDPRLYRMSVDQAVKSGKPSLILFATPGYCQTAVCGPGVDVLSKLTDTFGEKINSVHVEVYQLPYDDGKQVPAMGEWGLQTEPWLFLVDKDGKVAGRYEGGITAQELEPEVARLVQ